MTLEQIYPLFILIGTTIGAVLVYLWRQARNASSLNLALIRLNENLQFDTLIFLQSAWPLLARSGLRGFAWELDWFGVAKTGHAGTIDGAMLEREIVAAEMKLTIRFQQNKHAERRYFEEALIETFMLLLRTDMWIKAGTIDATFSQMSKLTLFLQHDMKNVAQFIQLMADQLANIPAGKEQQVLDYLRIAAPTVRHRADRIVRTLTIDPLQHDRVRTLLIHEEIDQICRLYQLDYHITGTAQIAVPENTLDSALDNVLKNYSDLHLREAGGKPVVTIVLVNNQSTIEIRISAVNSPFPAQLERLFEPFWTSDPAGLGIGLYQAKQALEHCKGSITAVQAEQGCLQFNIVLKKNVDSM